MALEPGSQAYNNALDNYITGNQGLDYEKDWEATEDEFYELAETTQTRRLHEAVRDLLLGRIEWEDMVESANLDEGEAKRIRLQLIQPTTAEGRDAYAAFHKAAEHAAEFFEHIPFDDHKTTELARELADDFWERKDRGY